VAVNVAKPLPHLDPQHRAGGLRLTALPAKRGSASSDRVFEALLSNDQLRSLLIQTALLAQAHDMESEVRAIRSLVVRLGVNRPLFDATRALVMLHRGQALAAIQTVERDVLLEEPGHELARAVLVSAWRALGRSDWQVHANALLSCTVDPHVRCIVGPSA
jgi:hypothetical protein